MNNEFHHVSVLLESSIEWLEIENAHTVVDCTLGGGGHSEAILKRLPPDGRLIGIDRDRDALKAASERLVCFGDRFLAIHGNFFDIETLLKENEVGPVDAIIADLGVSSYQLDTSERGFSYQQDAKLDMRMDQDAMLSAYEVVNDYSQDELYRIIRDYGEENWASRIAQFIVRERENKKIETTFELTQIIKNAIPARARRTGPHPAKRTFQAIRIEVNGELDRLGDAICSMVNCLDQDGRVGIITFHSLEDRIVKRTFQTLANPCTCPPKAPMCVCGKQAELKLISRKPILPTEEELEQNPRARSAKLRVAQKI